MKDRALVIALDKDFAKVKVQSEVSCSGCSARRACLGFKESNGALVVRNGLGAHPGDEVEIEVPDTAYSRDLGLLFGALLGASLFGVAAGYFLGPVFSISSSLSGAAGLLVGVALAGIVLNRQWRSPRKKKRYPEITAIFTKGGSHGTA